MGYFRFRRTFRIAPGVRLNASKSGVSASVGRRGAWFTIGPRGTRETIGIPGTGASYTQQTPPTPIRTGRTASAGLLVAVVVIGLLLAVVALFA